MIDTSIPITEWKNLISARNNIGLRGKLRYGALSALALTSRPKPGPSLRLFYCHYVFKDQIADFAAKIKYLTSIGTFLNADDVLAVINGEKPLDRRYFHLTFDDGFRNVISNAAPVMKDFGIPATFFVPTSIISANHDVVRNYCLNIVNQSGVIEMASWDELGRAQEDGIEIGSHTRTHARFSEISASNSRLEDEIFGSKTDIEKHLGKECRYISWPYGEITDADTSSLDFVKKAGYDACFGAFRGHIKPMETDRFYIPRHHFEPQWPLGHLKYFAHGGMERT